MLRALTLTPLQMATSTPRHSMNDG